MAVIWDFVKSMTVPMALIAVAAAIVFLGFGSMLTSPVGMVLCAAVVAGVLYWYWARKPAE